MRVAMLAYLTAKTSYSSRSAMTMLLPAVLREANRRWTGRLGPHDGGGVELLAQQREQPVVLPLAVDLQVAPRQALLAEADLPQHPLAGDVVRQGGGLRSEEHTSELQSLLRTSYTVFCLQTKNQVT